ncbi:Methyltransferase [Desulfosporosinus sp. I2]|nr:Methyltransferase [Desulfosporosinus sp. I2]
MEIAETLMGYDDQVPMLGCENAWIAAGALIAAIKNEGRSL